VVLGACVLALLVLTTATTPAAEAALGPIRLLSKDSRVQADSASEPALAAGGRFVAFDGSIAGVQSIFREELATGALVAVAPGRAPSISADGRYVSFTTTAALSPADPGASSSDVYVADLAASPPTFELASALDGSAQGLAYEGTGGAQAAPRVALSADGREVAFVTTAPSDLTSGPGGSTEGTPTPAGQVVLRDLDSDRTTLVSAVRDPLTGAMTEPPLPVPGGALLDRPLPQLKGAALSADGSTVAWYGGHLPAQVPLLEDEGAAIAELDKTEGRGYGEPLWRRVADGPSAPTRRIVGGGDPLAPGCPGTAGTLAMPACDGPFPDLTGKDVELNLAMGWLGVAGIDGIPQLSADGRRVALIGNPTEATNLFLVDMAPGLDRDQAVRQLTREIVVDPSNPNGTINAQAFIPLNGHVYDAAISADGGRVAFATARQRFPLAPPNLIGSAPASLGLVEVYLVDLEGETLRRVTHGVGGVGEPSQAPEGTASSGNGATSPSLDSDGRRIAFASTASNLIEGDGNESSDVFLDEDPAPPGGVVAGEVSTPPANRLPKRPWRLTLSAVSLADGRVRLVAIVPGAGTLRARSATQAEVGAKPRRLAPRRARARKGGRVSLVLTLPPRLRHRARTGEGVYAEARVSFAAKAHKPLKQTLQVRFHAHAKKNKKKGGGGR
jgi:Tol biopolymer transport system component